MTEPTPVTFTVDPWDPGYGLAFSEDLDGGALGESSAELNLDLELPAAEWHPIDPTRHPACPAQCCSWMGYAASTHESGAWPQPATRPRDSRIIRSRARVL